MKRYLRLLILLSLTCAAARADVYFSQTSAGAANGTSCANAETIPGSWTGGTTYHICTAGWSVGAANTTAMTVSSSGSSGNPITIIADQGAVTISAQYFSTSGGIILSGSYIVLNGDGNLTVANTQNGTGLTYAVASNGIILSGSNDTVENLTVANICQHTADTDLTGCAETSTGGILATSSNDTITLNTIHDVATGVWVASGSSSVVVSDNTISRTNWGIGGANTGNVSGLTITGNDITCIAGSATCNWDTTDDSYFHHNGVMLFPGSNTVTGLVIANNYFHDINGNYSGTNEVTAHIFLSPTGSGVISSPQIYNNVFVTTTTGGGPANAFIAADIDLTSHTGVTNALIANNTISGAGEWGFGSDDNGTIENNLATGGQYDIEYFDSGATGTINYNLGYGFTNGWSNTSSTLAAWKTASTSICTGGCDLNSLNSNPSLNSDYTLPSGSAARGAATNLTSLSIAGLDVGAPQYFGTAYACGTGCVARPSSGAWDIGAYPYQAPSGQSQMSGATFSGGGVH